MIKSKEIEDILIKAIKMAPQKEILYSKEELIQKMKKLSIEKEILILNQPRHVRAFRKINKFIPEESNIKLRVYEYVGVGRDTKENGIYVKIEYKDGNKV